MGTRIAPTYANLYMTHFETNVVYKYKNKPKYWFRFIDDVFCIYQGTEKSLKNFLDYLNTANEHLRFTATFSKTEIQFLDVVIKNKNGYLVSDLYTKPTDRYSYLNYQSCHPKSVKDSIPYSQFLRIRRNCSIWTDYLRHSTTLAFHLQKRGYPLDLVIRSLRKVGKESQKSLLQNNVSESTNMKRFYLILDYNPTLPNIRNLLQNHLQSWIEVHLLDL